MKVRGLNYWFMQFAALCRSRPASFILLSTAYFLVSAAAFNGYFEKWKLRDGEPRYSIEMMLDGTASRPFVYRQLLPDIANAVSSKIDDDVDLTLRKLIFKNGELRTKIEMPLATDASFIWRYHVVYYLAFLSFFLSCFSLRQVFISMGIGKLESTVAPALLVLAIPTFMTVGGYFYDLPELLFMSIAVWAALKGRWIYLLPISVIATWNKEAFLFFLLTLYPLLRVRLGRMTSALATGGAVLASGFTYLALRSRFADNLGGATELHISGALKFYTSPIELLKLEVNYGILGPKGYGLVALVVILLLCVRGWPGLPKAVRQHGLLVLLINVPLFVFFCFPGEMRNLSMLYVFLGALIATTIAGARSRSASEADQDHTKDDECGTREAKWREGLAK